MRGLELDLKNDKQGDIVHLANKRNNLYYPRLKTDYTEFYYEESVKAEKKFKNKNMDSNIKSDASESSEYSKLNEDYQNIQFN